MNFDYFSELPSAVTVCDKNGVVLYMNNKAAKTFEKWGGMSLVGQNLFDCHNSTSVEMIKMMMESGKTNNYTIEKNGIKKLISQTPWYNNNELMGMVEISIEIPLEMKHFIR